MLRDVRPAERGYSRRAVIMASAKGFPRDTLFRLIAGRARQTIHICRRQSISPDMMYNNMAVAGGEPLNRRARVDARYYAATICSRIPAAPRKADISIPADRWIFPSVSSSYPSSSGPLLFSPLRGYVFTAASTSMLPDPSRRYLAYLYRGGSKHPRLRLVSAANGPRRGRRGRTKSLRALEYNRLASATATALRRIVSCRKFHFSRRK